MFLVVTSYFKNLLFHNFVLQDTVEKNSGLGISIYSTYNLLIEKLSGSLTTFNMKTRYVQYTYNYYGACIKRMNMTLN